MKKLLLIFLFFCLSSNLTSQDLGLGLILNEPSGITGKYYFSKDNHVVLNLGDFGGPLRIDFLYFWNLDVFKDKQFGLYLGVGGLLIFPNKRAHRGYNEKFNNNDLSIGIKGTVGVNYFLKKRDFEFFIEVSPIVLFTESSFGALRPGLGVRYYP